MLAILRHVPRAPCAVRCLSTPAPVKVGEKVGRLRKPLVEGQYKAGQLFLHNKLDCRGVVLCAWPVRKFDRNAAGFPDTFDRYFKRGEAMSVDPDEPLDIPEPPIFSTDIYYQALFDQRDASYYKIQHQDSGFTFLGQDSLFRSVPGLDYVSHSDVLPYDTFHPAVKDPIFHPSLFNKFLCQVSSEEANKELEPIRYTSTREWQDWLSTYYESMLLKDVHIQTTNNIRISVYCFYLGAKEGQQMKGAENWWRYCILMENLGNVKVQLRERNWHIFNNNGTRDIVTGRGVVGKEPILNPTEFFQYSSSVNLRSDSGHMWGTYIFEQEDGEFLTVKIPPFLLNKTPPAVRVTKDK